MLQNKALIHAVFPRKSIIERKALGKLGQTQIIATNNRFRVHFESDSKERKKKNKEFGKMVKNVKKQRRHNKY